MTIITGTMATENQISAAADSIHEAAAEGYFDSALEVRDEARSRTCQCIPSHTATVTVTVTVAQKQREPEHERLGSDLL